MSDCHVPIPSYSPIPPISNVTIFPQRVSRLPLSLLSRTELLQNGHNLLQRAQPCRQPLIDLGLIIAQLLVKVLAVRGSAHGGAEERLDDEGMVGLEGLAVGAAEGVAELLGWIGEVGAKGLGGEVETANRSVSVCTLRSRGT
jgi:hypothetical protein